MFIRLEEEHLPMMVEYIKNYKEETLYLAKPLEMMRRSNPQGVFYGYRIENRLMGIFYFSNKSVLALHCRDQKILGNLQLLKAIKFHKPRFIKGVQSMTDGVYKLICRAVSSVTENKSTLMVFENKTIISKKIDGFDLITDKNEMVDELLADLRFFIDVETHFGRQVKAINDIVKEFRALINQENYLLIVKERQIVAQGLIEDETEAMGVLAGIYVSPTYRRKGLGEWVASALTDTVLKREKTPYLFVKNNNGHALKLYEKMGYRAVTHYSMLTIHY